nr:hypothetical protein [Tanacetum cinerariifolium]
MIIPEFNRTQKILYEVDELRAISGHMLGASGVQIPEKNLDNLHSIIEDVTLEIVDPQELLGSFLLATNDILILDLLTGIVFLASLDFLEYTNVTTGLDALLSIGTGFLRGTIEVVVILVKGHTFPTNVKVHPVGCDPLSLESKFTHVEESTRVRNKMHKAFPLPGIEFPLAKEVPTTSEEGCHWQKKREATARKIALLSKSRRNCQSKSNDSFTKLVPPCHVLCFRNNHKCNIVYKDSLSYKRSPLVIVESIS